MNGKCNVFILFIISALFLSCASKKHIARINTFLIDGDVYATSYDGLFIPPKHNGVKEMYVYYSSEADFVPLTPSDSLFFDRGGKLRKHVHYNPELHGSQISTKAYSYDKRNRIKKVIFENENKTFYEYFYKAGVIERIKINGEKEVRKYKSKRLAEREIYNADSLIRSYKYFYDDKGYLTELFDNRWNDSVHTKYIFTYEQAQNSSVFVKGVYFIRNLDGLYEEYKSVIPTRIYLSYFHNQVMYYNFKGTNYEYGYDKRGSCVKIDTGYSVSREIRYY